jgi:hypothetical protein
MISAALRCGVRSDGGAGGSVGFGLLCHLRRSKRKAHQLSARFKADGGAAAATCLSLWDRVPIL